MKCYEVKWCVLVCFSGFLSTKEIFPYDKYKDKYGKPRSNKGFNEGLWEIEHNRWVEYGVDVSKKYSFDFFLIIAAENVKKLCI